MALQTKTCIARFVAVGAVLLTGCQTPQAPSAAQTAVKQMDVNGALLSFVDEGQGVPVVFVHAALGDYRTWDRQRAVLAGQYRTIAFSQRYFGAGPWGQDWPKFGVPTHAADLVTFIRALNAGPVHLIAWSYSGHVALDVADRKSVV